MMDMYGMYGWIMMDVDNVEKYTHHHIYITRRAERCVVNKYFLLTSLQQKRGREMMCGFGKCATTNHNIS
jgi:hypothetical protein